MNRSRASRPRCAAKQLQRAVNIGLTAQAHQDPVRPRSPEVDPCVAAELDTELAHDFAGQPYVRLAVMTVGDLARSEPQCGFMPTELRLTDGHAAEPSATLHEVVGEAHALSASTTRRTEPSTPKRCARAATCIGSGGDFGMEPSPVTSIAQSRTGPTTVRAART